MFCGAKHVTFVGQVDRARGIYAGTLEATAVVSKNMN